jgi:hypothetical protein
LRPVPGDGGPSGGRFVSLEEHERLQGRVHLLELSNEHLTAALRSLRDYVYGSGARGNPL